MVDGGQLLPPAVDRGRTRPGGGRGHVRPVLVTDRTKYDAQEKMANKEKEHEKLVARCREFLGDDAIPIGFE